jgi:holo-[acyl-carrier protein] synthase
MVLGIGLDLIEIERIRQVMERHPGFMSRILTEAEREYCLASTRSSECVAGRWAAKEAVAKALGQVMLWHDVEILPDRHGAPQVVLHGRAAQLAQDSQILVNITHTHTTAAAVAIWVRNS